MAFRLLKSGYFNRKRVEFAPPFSFVFSENFLLCLLGEGFFGNEGEIVLGNGLASQLGIVGTEHQDALSCIEEGVDVGDADANQQAMKKNNIWELILKVIVAAITAALTAITTTSCIGYGPFFG